MWTALFLVCCLAAVGAAPADHLIALSKEHTVVLNTVVDALLLKAKQMIESTGTDTMPIPDVKETFYKGWKYMHISGEFEGTKGWIGRLSSMKRTGDAVLYSSDDGIKLSASLGLDDLVVGFNSYTARVALTRLQGSTEAKIADNSVHVVILLHYDDDKCTAELKSVDIEKVGDVSVSIKGGWRLTNWFYGKIASYIVNHAKQTIQKEVTERLFNDFKKVLADYDICKEIPPVH